MIESAGKSSCGNVRIINFNISRVLLATSPPSLPCGRFGRCALPCPMCLNCSKYDRRLLAPQGGLLAASCAPALEGTTLGAGPWPPVAAARHVQESASGLPSMPLLFVVCYPLAFPPPGIGRRAPLASRRSAFWSGGKARGAISRTLGNDRKKNCGKVCSNGKN